MEIVGVPKKQGKKPKKGATYFGFYDILGMNNISTFSKNPVWVLHSYSDGK